MRATREEMAAAMDRASKPRQLRRFEAAKASRLTASWTTTSEHINRHLYGDLRALRARARDLTLNNDYARKFLGMVRNNVVGANGITCQVQALTASGKIDQRDSTVLENAFWDWGRRGNCEVSGRLSWIDVQNLVMETIARDGEVIVREVTGRGKYAYQLQLIDVDLLDETFNATAPNGNKVRMGVEYDAFGAMVALHLTNADAADPTAYSTQYGRRTRVAAEECRLLFVSQHVGQLRGVPWMHTAMLRMHQLGGFEESAVVAARAGAAKMGFYIKGENATQPNAVAGETDENNNVVDSVEPGMLEELPYGWDFKSHDPQYPHAHYGDFVRACLRGMAAGLGVSYTGLANDLENVNYSSIRAGVLDEREVWKTLQRWLIENLCDWVYSRWLWHTLSYTAHLGPLPIDRYDKYNAPVFQGRRWDWVDPEKDVNAQIIAIDKGLKSYSQVIREMGRDPTEVWLELAADKKAMQEAGINPGAAKAALSASGDPNADPKADR